MRYRYLDTPPDQLIALRSDIHFFCACGRHVCFGPEDFAKWPNSSLHQIAARLRCTGCGALGNVPEVRVTAVSTRSVGSGTGGGHSDSVPVSRGSQIPTTHPSRRGRHKGYTDGVKRMKAPKPLTGRALKDALMPQAREIAGTGRHPRWLDVVLQFESWEQSDLRHYMTHKERDELEMIALSARRHAVRLPACCPVGAIGAH